MIPKQIPQQYRSDFIEAQTVLIKNRTRLLCMLAVGLYFLASVLSFIVAPQDFKAQEIPISLSLLAGGFLVAYLAGSSRRLSWAKFYAYLFCLLMLFVITKVSIIYYDSIHLSASLYVFILFLVSFTIPWMPLEIVFISLLSIGAYACLFFYIYNFLPQARAYFATMTYLEGNILIFIASIMAVMIKAKEVSRETENFVLLKELAKKNQQMERELELATKIHKTLVPKSISTDLVDVAAMYLPAYYLGGDYAHFNFVDKDKLLFIICDVTGHGVSAALLVNRLHIEFEALSKKDKEPGILLEELNRFILKDFSQSDMYLSAFCGMLDFKNKKFSYSNHGHPAQYVYRIRESVIIPCSPEAALLGIPLDDEKVSQREIDFDNGDKILLFTDGVIETTNKEGQEYGKERVEDFMIKNFGLAANMFNQVLLNDLNDFKYDKFKDDIFILTIGIK